MGSDGRAEMAQVSFRNNYLEINDLRIKERDNSLSSFCQMGKNALFFPASLLLLSFLSLPPMFCQSGTGFLSSFSKVRDISRLC